MKRYVWLVSLLLVTVAAALAAELVNAYLSAQRVAPLKLTQTQASRTSGARAPQAPLTQYEVINKTKRTSFTATPPLDTPELPRAAEPPPPPPDVLATPLPLKLVGILAETKAPAPRFAIIESTGSAPSQAIYQVGDRVQQVVIVDILPGCVVLNRDGAQQQLCLEEVTETAPAPDAALHIVDILPGCVVLNRDGAQQQLCFEEITETAPAPDAALRAAAAPVPSPAPQPDDVSGADTVRIDAETWQIRRETLLEHFANMGSLSSQATVTPYFVQGQQRGFRLSQIRAGGIFQHMGLQEGDVLQQVNGLDIHTPQEVLQAYQQLYTASTVRLSILRNHSATTLTYDIR